MTQVNIGIDISKEYLDLHRLPDGQRQRIENSSEGVQFLKAWLKPTPGARVIFEATGNYHRVIEAGLDGLDVGICKVNPGRVRHFAKACGMNAKTDRQDALLLAKYGQALELEPKPAKSKQAVELQELETARRNLSKERTSLLNQREVYTLDVIKRQNEQRLQQVEKCLKEIVKEIQNHMKACRLMKRKLEILCSIPGISTVSSAAILTELPEIGTLQSKQAASLAGLAPKIKESGKWVGKAKIHGGRTFLRKALYMPALTASWHNPDMKCLYERLVADGKPKKVALVAVMRKLIILANALIKHDRLWSENHA